MAGSRSSEQILRELSPSSSTSTLSPLLSPASLERSQLSPAVGHLLVARRDGPRHTPQLQPQQEDHSLSLQETLVYTCLSCGQGRVQCLRPSHLGKLRVPWVAAKRPEMKVHTPPPRPRKVSKGCPTKVTGAGTEAARTRHHSQRGFY